MTTYNTPEELRTAFPEHFAREEREKAYWKEYGTDFEG